MYIPELTIKKLVHDYVRFYGLILSFLLDYTQYIVYVYVLLV
jgi:hypothetical protein